MLHTTSSTTPSVAERLQGVWPEAQRLAGDAQSSARHGLDTLQHRSRQLRARAGEAGERGLSYLREEPIKPVIVAALAAGALMALAQWLARRSHGRL